MEDSRGLQLNTYIGPCPPAYTVKKIKFKIMSPTFKMCVCVCVHFHLLIVMLELSGVVK